MTDRPTPETDAEVTSYFEKKHPPIVCYHELAKFARRLEHERDEARDAAEKTKAFKRVMKDDNAKLRRELDELNKRLIEVCQYGVVCTIEREDLHKELDEAREELASERALADRMGHSIERLCNMSPLIYAHAMDDLNAWKEARK